MAFRKFVAAAGAVALGIALANSPANAEPTVVKVGSFTPPNSGFLVDVLIPWLRTVENDSQGTLKFQEFWGGQLIRAPEKQYEGMLNGIQDASQILPSYTQALFPDFGIFSLPMLFRGAGALEASLAAWQMYEKGMLGGLDKVYVNAVYTNDNSGLHFNRSIKTADEMKGLKVRVAGPEEADVAKALDLVPVAMGTPQVAESLHRGVIQGTLTGWSALTMFRITPLVKTHVEIPLGVRSFFTGITKTVYDKLPQPAKDSMAKHGGAKLSRAMGEYYERDAVNMRKNPEGREILTPTQAQLDDYAKRLKPLHDEWIKSVQDGEKKYKAMQEILAGLRKSS
jgi:TRAP-type C4-dicarboxylate transport system substrate-binding protein